MKPKQPPTMTFHPGQHFQIMDEVVHDPYLNDEKLSEPSICGACGAVYHKGHWQWREAPADANKTQCPACKRIHDELPAGYVSVQGQFAREHYDEILSLVHHLETHEKAEHPLKRIMSIDSDGDDLLITTTDIHLARGIGEALQKAYKGELDFHYNDAEYLLRVRWQR